MRIVFFIVLVIYLLPAFAAGAGWTYIQRNGDRDYLLSHWTFFLPVSLVLWLLLMWLLVKAFPALWQQYRKFMYIAAVVLFIGIVILNTGYIRFVNCYMGEQKTVLIEGIITDKDKIRKRKGKRSRYIDIAGNGKEYSFRVKSNAYNEAEIGAGFSKEFTIGSLGILYREDK